MEATMLTACVSQCYRMWIIFLHRMIRVDIAKLQLSRFQFYAVSQNILISRSFEKFYAAKKIVPHRHMLREQKIFLASHAGIRSQHRERREDNAYLI